MRLRRGLINASFHLPDNEAEIILRFFLPFFIQKITHVRRQPVQPPHAEIHAVFPDKRMCRHIIEMFGSRDLCSIFSLQIHMVFPDQFNKPVQLGRNQKSIYRITEQDQVRLFQFFPACVKVFFIHPDLLSGMDHAETAFRKHLFQIQHRLQRYAVFSLRGSVYYRNSHVICFRFLLNDFCSRDYFPL